MPTHPQQPDRDALRRVAEESFGWNVLREGQLDAMAAAARGEDVLAVMPSGHGKSAVYQVPAVALPGTAVVISPLIALQEDQLDRLTTIWAPAAPSPSTRRSGVGRTGRLGSRGKRRGKVPVPGPGTAGQDRNRGAARGPGRLAVRGGRGALRLLLGPRFPARLPAAGEVREAAGQPAGGRP